MKPRRPAVKDALDRIGGARTQRKAALASARAARKAAAKKRKLESEAATPAGAE